MKLLLTIVVIALLGCSQDVPCSQVAKEYSSISTNIKDKAFLVNWINRYVEKSKLCLDALVIRADLFNSIDSFELAKKDYLNIVRKDSSNIYCLYQLGLLYQSLNQNDSAVECFTKAISRKTRDGVIISYSKTPGIVDKFSKYDVNHNELLFCRGVSFYAPRNLKKAMSDFNICLEDNYSLKDVYLYVGGINYENGDTEKACDFFYKADRYQNESAKKYIEKYCNK